MRMFLEAVRKLKVCTSDIVGIMIADVFHLLSKTKPCKFELNRKHVQAKLAKWLTSSHLSLIPRQVQVLLSELFLVVVIYRK